MNMDYKTKYAIDVPVCFTTANRGVMKGVIIGVSIEHAFEGDRVPSYGQASGRGRMPIKVRYSILVKAKTRTGREAEETVEVADENRCAGTMEEAWELAT